MRWTDDLIVDGIEQVRSLLGIDRMPTFSECNECTGSTALTQAIVVRGGFLYWGRILGYCRKDDYTSDGLNAFTVVAEECAKRDIVLRLDEMSNGPVVYAGDNVCYIHAARTYVQGKFPRYQSFVSSQQRRDYDIVVCEADMVYIIPRELTMSKRLVTFGMNYSKWDKWLNAWHLLKEVKNDKVTLK